MYELIVNIFQPVSAIFILIHNTSIFSSLSGNHHSQQTDTRAENEIPHILTHRQVMNNENTWTQGREYYTLGSIGGNRGGTAWRGPGEGQHGEKCQMSVKGRKAAKHTAMCVPMQLSFMFCTCTPKPKTIKNKKIKKNQPGMVVHTSNPSHSGD